jgi:hypothetical protein
MLFSAEEQGRILRVLARDWRRELRLIGVLFRAAPHEPRSSTRLHADQVESLLPPNPDRPTDLLTYLPALFPGAAGLAASIAPILVDEVTASPPDRGEIGVMLREHGLNPAALVDIERLLAMPARVEARRLRTQIEALHKQGLRVAPPAVRGAKPRKPPIRSSVVRTIHVGGGEGRRRKVGEEGERWALAAVIEPLLDLPTRQRALPQIRDLLSTFEGEPVERALAHFEPAMSTELDDEELIDELTGLLYVVRYSDDFGFDLLGWLPPVAGHDPIAMCLEAKSSGDGTFHFSAGEWTVASQLRDDGRGDEYAVLVVRRRIDPVPESLDLLVDPVTQCDQGLMSRRDDGYVLAY